MKIIQDFPPNIQQIVQRFKITPDTVFAYGDILYSPLSTIIPQDLMVHEETHEQQQKSYGVDQWWAMYLENKAFRLTQEVEAYRNQYQYLKTILNRKGRFGALHRLADDLSSELYGNIISKKEAKELIDV